MRRLFAVIVGLGVVALLLAGYFAYSSDQSVQRRLKDLVQLETPHLLDVQTQTNQSLQHTNRALQDSEQKLTVTLNSIGVAGNLVVGAVAVFRNVSDEHAALQSAIFNSANFSGIATDARGVIQIFTVGAERMLGYTAAEVMNIRTPADISDPQEVIERAKALSVELATEITPGFEALVFKAARGIEDIYELTYIRKDGSRFPAVVSVTALRDEDNAINGYLLIGADNTARKAVEAERAQLDRALQIKNRELETARATADKANQAKSEFLSSMSHELRSPLNAILGFAQLMESGQPTPTPAQTGSIDQILKAGWYLLELIDEVLDLALIESGRLSMSLEPVSLPEVLLDCQTMIEPLASKRLVELMRGSIGTHAPARRDSDGHQPTWHQRSAGIGLAARRPAHQAHPRAGAQRQRHAARHRAGHGGWLLPLPDQTDQDCRIHGGAERKPGFGQNRIWSTKNMTNWHLAHINTARAAIILGVFSC